MVLGREEITMLENESESEKIREIGAVLWMS